MADTLSISDLAKVVKESNLPTSKAEALEAAFMPFYEQVAKHCETAFTIKVTNIGQTAEMGRAKQSRLALRDIRISTEKVRKQVKEDALREGQAIDKIAKHLCSVIEPMEKYLEDQEKYGERQREIFQAQQRDLRTCEFGKYIEFLPSGVDLGLIGDEDHAKYLSMAKAMWNEREAEKVRVENERIAKEELEAAERELLWAENERLKAEAAKRNAEIAAERAENERLRMEAEAKEREEKQRIETDRKAKELAERAAKEAPDKEKLLRYCDHILSIEIPKIESETLNQKLSEAKGLIRRAIQLISEP